MNTTQFICAIDRTVKNIYDAQEALIFNCNEKQWVMAGESLGKMQQAALQLKELASLMINEVWGQSAKEKK